MKIERVLVCGAGTTGGGIARTCAASSLDVTIVERNESSLDRAMKQIEANLDHEISHWGLTESEKKVILSRIKGEAGVRSFDRIDAVIDALPEQMALKQRMMTQLEKSTGEDTLFVSNVGALSVTELAAKMDRPENVIGLHFLPPVHTIPVVEIIRGLNTSETTLENARQLIEILGKTPVEVTEYPGYITTRCMLPMLNEAMYIVMEGVANATDVDTAMKLGYKLNEGPLTMADRMGLDNLMYQMETLFHELGELKYRPCPLLRKMVRAGHLGVKSGQGFFEYPDMIHQGNEA